MKLSFQVTLVASFSLFFTSLHASHALKENSFGFSSAIETNSKPLRYTREFLLSFQNLVKPDPEIAARIPESLRKILPIQAERNEDQISSGSQQLSN